MPLIWRMTVTILIALLFEHFQIVAVDLRRQFSFHPADRLFHVVFNRLGEAPDDSRDLVEFALHGGDQFILVFMECRAPLLFRFQVNEVLGVEKPGVVGSIVRTPDLAGALRDFRERAKHDSRLIGDPDALVRPGAGRKRAAHPECAFIQMGQEIRNR